MGNLDYRKNLFILSAPSATGKNTVYGLLKDMLSKVERGITVTTRKPRNNEVDGVDYYFISTELFEEKSDKGEFVERNYYDEGFYATPLSEIERYPETVPLFLIVDTNGMKQIKRKYPCVTSIFLMPPSIEELERRIRTRGDNTSQEIERRIKRAKTEIENSSEYDHVIVNDKIETCVNSIASIVREKFNV